MRRQGAVRKADGLAVWLETLLHLYGDRILPLDVTVARQLGFCRIRRAAQDRRLDGLIWRLRLRRRAGAIRC